jgi:hypothetical protein
VLLQVIWAGTICVGVWNGCRVAASAGREWLGSQLEVGVRCRKVILRVVSGGF